MIILSIFLSCGPSGGSRSCSCVGQGAFGSLDLVLPLSQNPVTCGSTFTLNQTHLSGSMIINGEVHPNMTTNTGSWAGDIVYKINQVEVFRKNYTYGSPSNTYTKSLPILGNIQLGTNTITVEAECNNQPGTFCPICSFTIIMTNVQGNITLKSACCSWSTKLLMTGNFTGASSVPGEVITGNLKIEKPAGQNNWVQVGALIPFLNGGYTPCYPRASSTQGQSYRATLLDLAGNPMTNNTAATSFPFVFGICRDCCPPME